MDSLHQAVSKNLQCPICLELLKEPKVLSCKHMFCLSCLRALFNSQLGQKSMSCPLCRQRTDVNNGNLENLATNNQIKSMVEDVKNSQQQCANCEGEAMTKATTYCQDCKQYLCDECQEKHNAWRPFSEHETITVDDIRQGRAVPRIRVICQEHKPEEGEHLCTDVCITCGKIICMRCRLFVHEKNNHHVISSSEFKEKIHSENNTLLKAADAKINSMEKYEQAVRCEKTKIDEHSQSQIQHITKTYNERAQKLVTEKKTLIEKVKERQKSALHKLNSPQKHIFRIRNAKELVATVSKAPLQGQDLGLQKSLSKELQEMLDTDEDFSSSVKDVSRQFRSVLFQKSTSQYYDSGLGEIMVWEIKKEVELPEDSMSAVASTRNGTQIAVVCIGHGIKIYSTEGKLQHTMLKDEHVSDVAFLSDGRYIVCALHAISLYTAESEELDVLFETLSDTCCVTVDHDDRIYISSMEGKKIKVFTPAGGKSVREIQLECNRYPVYQTSVMKSTNMLVVMCGKSVHVIDECGVVKHTVTKDGPYGYPTVCRDDSILIAWVKHNEGLVNIDQYTNELEYMTTLITDHKIQKPKRRWYYLREFMTGELALCTCGRLYIFHKSLAEAVV